jgi:hypothetical protein
MGRKSRIGPVGNCEISSHMGMNTDNIPGISGGDRDYPIAFSLFQTYAINYFRNRATSFEIPLTTKGLKELTNEKLVAESPVTYRTWKFQGNPLIHVPSFIKNREISDPFATAMKMKKGRLIGKGSNKKTLINLLILYGLTNQSIAAVTEFGSEALVQKDLYMIDARVYASMTIEEWESATATAAAVLVVNLFVTTGLRTQSRVLITGSAQGYAKLLTGLWVRHAIRNGDLAMSPGSKGSDIAREKLSSKLAGSARALALTMHENPEFIEAFQVHRYVDTRVPRGTVLGVAMAGLLWSSHLEVIIRLKRNYEDVARIFRQMKLITRQVLFRNESGQLTIDEFMGLHKLIRYRLEGLEWPAPIGLLADYIERGGAEWSTSLHEAWRMFRATPSSKRATEIARQVNSKVVPMPELESRTYSHPARRMLDRSDGLETKLISLRDRYEAFRARFRTYYNPHTRASDHWWRALESIKITESVLIVGIGAGGIADVLEQRGLTKMLGLDLNEAIPREAVGNISYVPIACKRTRLSKSSHIKTGNWFSQEILDDIKITDNFDNVVIDIEKGKERYGPEQLRPLEKQNFRGRVFSKYYVHSAEEADWILARLEETGWKINGCYLSARLDTEETTEWGPSTGREYLSMDKSGVLIIESQLGRCFPKEHPFISEYDYKLNIAHTPKKYQRIDVNATLENALGYIPVERIAAADVLIKEIGRILNETQAKGSKIKIDPSLKRRCIILKDIIEGGESRNIEYFHELVSNPKKYSRSERNLIEKTSPRLLALLKAQAKGDEQL